MQQSELESHVKQQLVLKYLNQAIGDMADIPWHIATRLFKTGLVEPIALERPIDKKLIDALSEDSRLQINFNSPIYFLTESQIKLLNIQYIEITDLLSNRNIEIIKLIAPSINRAIETHVSSKSIRDLVRDYIRYVDTKDIVNILRTAALIDESLAENWEWNISLLNQSSQLDISSLVDRQVSRLLNIEAIAPELFDDLHSEYNQAKEIITYTKNIHKQGSNITGYDLESIGSVMAHLPWECDLGFSALISQCTADLSSNEIWTEMYKWMADDTPAWWFNIWYTAVANPEVVPNESWPELWEKIQILLGADNAGHARDVVCARRYIKLLQYYIHTLELSLQSGDIEFLYWSASKLASSVVGSCDSELENIDTKIDKAASSAKLVWQIAAPDLPHTSIRAAFIEFDNYWIPSFQSSISKWKPEVKNLISDQSFEYIDDLIKGMTVKMGVSEGSEIDGFGEYLISDLSVIREEWIDIVSDQQARNFIIECLSLRNKYSDPKVIIAKLSEPLEEDDAQGVVAFLRLCSYIRDGRINTKSILELISDAQWKETVEPSIHVEYIYQLIESLLISKWAGSDNLHVTLPHWAAQQCVNYIEDDDRCRVYSMAAVLFSVKGNVSSAITRMKREKNGQVLKHNLDNLSETLKDVLHISPGWLSGRLRAVLAALS